MAMASNNKSLWRLQSIHADLFRRKAALESLRKQVQRKEAERDAKIAYVGQRTKKSPKTVRRQARTGVATDLQRSFFGNKFVHEPIHLSRGPRDHKAIDY